MAALTGQEIRNSVKGNLGNRDSGKIGTRDIDDAILHFVNRALFKVPRRYNLPILERNLDIDVDNSAYQYELPTTYGTDTIRIKNFIKLVSQKDGESYGVPLTRLSTQKRDTIFPLTSSNAQTGPPRWYSVFAEYIELFPYPDDEAYTLHVRANIWPTKFTSATMSSSHVLGEEWDEYLEMYATFLAFKSLQQVQEAKLWLEDSKDILDELLTALRSTPDWIADSNVVSAGISVDPQNDPCVGSWNS